MGGAEEKLVTQDDRNEGLLLDEMDSIRGICRDGTFMDLPDHGGRGQHVVGHQSLPQKGHHSALPSGSDRLGGMPLFHRRMVAAIATSVKQLTSFRTLLYPLRRVETRADCHVTIHTPAKISTTPTRCRSSIRSPRITAESRRADTGMRFPKMLARDGPIPRTP